MQNNQLPTKAPVQYKGHLYCPILLQKSHKRGWNHGCLLLFWHFCLSVWLKVAWGRVDVQKMLMGLNPKKVDLNHILFVSIERRTYNSEKGEEEGEMLPTGERGSYCIRAYYHSFIQHKSPEIVCSLEITFLVDLKLGLALKTLISVLEIICFELATTLQRGGRGVQFLCWMDERYSCTQ